MSSIKRDSTGPVGPPCENFLYGFKAARRAARAAATAPRPSLPLRSRCAPDGRANVGRLARQAGYFGAAITPESSGAGAVTDLTREPSRRPTSGTCGQAEASPIRGQAYGPPPLVKSAAPSAQADMLSPLLR